MKASGSHFFSVLSAVVILSVTVPDCRWVPSSPDNSRPFVTQGRADKSASPATLREKYQILEIAPFEVSEGTEFPPQYVSMLQKQILDELKKSPDFAEVHLAGNDSEKSDEAVLKLSGTVEYFDPGNRGKRYIGFGMGAGHLQVRVVFRDRATGSPVSTQVVSATLSGGLFGGKSEGIAHEFAKKLKDTTRLLMGKVVSSGPEGSSQIDLQPVDTSLEQKLLTLSASDLDHAQVELNTAAQAGFRMIGFIPKGTKSADIRMAKVAEPPNNYDYKFMRVHWLNNLQKDMNKAAAQGYRYSPDTLAQLGGVVAFAIMEKAPVPETVRYEYRVNGAVKISNSQKTIDQAQKENFTLVGTLDTSGVHVVLLERAVPESRK